MDIWIVGNRLKELVICSFELKEQSCGKTCVSYFCKLKYYS